MAFGAPLLRRAFASGPSLRILRSPLRQNDTTFCLTAVSPLVKTQVNLFGHKLLDTASLTLVDTHARTLCPQLSTRLTSSGRAFELLVPPVASRELHWCLQQWLHRTNHAREQVSCLTSNSSGRQTPILAFVPSFAGHSRSNLCPAFLDLLDTSHSRNH